MQQQGIKKQDIHQTIIDRHTFLHNNLPYIYKIHNAKLHLLFHTKLYNNEFTNSIKLKEPLTDYLNKIPTKQFPHHIFKKHLDFNAPKQRASNIEFKTLKITKLKKQNLANKLASLALNLANSNKQRHQAIQDFMLTNDSTTIATEIPVYLTKDDILYFQSRGFNATSLITQKTPITGHIDILQIRNSLIHILDYKPDAKTENPIKIGRAHV